MDDSDIVSKESMETAPNRVIVLDDLMNDAFNSKDKSIDSTMKLLMTKLSHHNNMEVAAAKKMIPLVNVNYKRHYPK